MNLTQKIFGIALVVLTLMLTVTVLSIQLTQRISAELDEVVARQMPVSEVVTRINLNLLNQGWLLQRQLVARELGDPDPEAVEKFQTISRDTINEFDLAHRLLLAEESSEPVHRQAIEELDDDLQTIEKAYDVFQGLRLAVLAADAVHDGGLTAPDEDVLNRHMDAMAADIADLRKNLAAQTQAAVQRADANEKKLLWANTFLTLLATVLGLGFAAIVTRMLVKTVVNLVKGAKAVESGNLDIAVPIISRDEIGQLTGSFNQMVGELRLKERIKDTFGKYMDPRIVENMLDDPSFTELGGERREMTVMFIDIKGFTSIAERLEPDALVELINDFFGHMTDAISRNGGVVDKFMGDAVLAYWGPPFTRADEHAVKACQAALDALTELAKFRIELAREVSKDGEEALDIDLRIGISTGEVIVGTIGSKATRSYTVMGDPVNLGSRLEGANKAYSTRVIISERTYEMAAPVVKARELDLIRVKGKQAPTRIYELQNPPPVSDASTELDEDWIGQGLASYRRQDWDRAEQAFRNRCEEREDPVAKVYLQRIATLRDRSLPEDWDGVWIFETK